jgi:heptosyltransferase-2
MSASPASASGTDRPPAGGTLWIRGVNWLGDSVMTLPALAAFKHAHPGARLLVGCRAGLEEFWSLCPAVEAVTRLPPGWRGDLAAARELRRLGVDRAVMFPNSFRSAWVPFLAGIPERAGFPGHARRFLLTRLVHPVSYSGSVHQALDYFTLLGVAPDAVPPGMDGLMRIPEGTLARMGERIRSAAAGLAAFPSAGPWIAVAPGAARGGAKRWPAGHFAAAAAALARARGCGVIVCGTAAERGAGEQIAAAAPGGALNLAGATGLAELAAVFRLCRLVVCNDSGAMHLAAAAGTPVVAVFGLTDPARTGPLGRGHEILAPSGVTGDAAIARESDAAAAALASIRPESAVAAALRVLDGTSNA